jgi:hypothetical protein
LYLGMPVRALVSARTSSAGKGDGIMFMQHRVEKKGLSAITMAGSVDNIFRMLSIREAARGDTWRLGDTGSALVLCQAMGVNGQESFVMTVAVSNDQAGVGIIDSVNQKIKGTQGL